MTFKKILVGLDQSFKDSLVFGQALDQAKPHATSLMMVHTLHMESDVAADLAAGAHAAEAHSGEALDMYEMLRRMQQRRFDQERAKADRWLQFYFQQAIAKGIPTQIDCRVSEPELWLCDLAQRWGADLIVIGHHENHGLKRSGRGSVSQYVLQHAACSVLVVHGVLHADEFNHLDKVPDIKTVETPGHQRMMSQMYKI
jgi:nucleotide-binding universal stress UspA family protein